jgi:hypothetical protein
MAKPNHSSNKIDEQLPKLAKAATGAAYKRALRVGSVVVYRNGELRRVEADGESTVIKKLEPRTWIPKGTKFTIEPTEG